jgi:splicing factor 45
LALAIVYSSSKTVQGKSVVEVFVWDPDELFDPRQPNDYYDYKNMKKREREEERERRILEKERKRFRRSESYSDYSYSDGEYDRKPRKQGLSINIFIF